MSSFSHNIDTNVSTLTELRRVYDSVSPDNFFGCYAYATQSGYRAFDLAFGGTFWSKASSRWLFGIDYGRTDPRALREIADRPNAEVRIFDGAWVVNQHRFIPRRDFHAKIGMMQSTKTKKFGMVLGSGNFSYNGLKRSVEAGAAFVVGPGSAFKEQIAPVKEPFEEFWKFATPLADIVDAYEVIRATITSEQDAKKPKVPIKKVTKFWIEAGYVTKNRGADKPGNQIFFPPGFRTFFGFANVVVDKSEVIGPVIFTTKVGPPVMNPLRLNHNGMEKISLPIPETHGFGVYDGKVLVFERNGQSFLMSAYESNEFDTLFGSELADVRKMNGGRRYGAMI